MKQLEHLKQFLRDQRTVAAEATGADSPGTITLRPLTLSNPFLCSVLQLTYSKSDAAWAVCPSQTVYG